MTPWWMLALLFSPPESIESAESADSTQPVATESEQTPSPGSQPVAPSVPEGPQPLPELGDEILGPLDTASIAEQTGLVDNGEFRLELDPTPGALRPPNWSAGWVRERWALTLRPLDVSEVGADRTTPSNLTHAPMGDRPFLRPLSSSVLPEAGGAAFGFAQPSSAGAALVFEWRLKKSREGLSPTMGLFVAPQMAANGLYRDDLRGTTVDAQLPSEANGAPRVGGAVTMGFVFRF